MTHHSCARPLPEAAHATCALATRIFKCHETLMVPRNWMSNLIRVGREPVSVSEPCPSHFGRDMLLVAMASSANKKVCWAPPRAFSWDLIWVRICENFEAPRGLFLGLREISFFSNVSSFRGCSNTVGVRLGVLRETVFGAISEIFLDFCGGSFRELFFDECFAFWRVARIRFGPAGGGWLFLFGPAPV